MNYTELSEQELIRRQALEEIRKMGIDPYPAALFEVNTSIEEIRKNFSPERNNFQEVRLAGRIMSRRIMGSASFSEIQDATGRIQLYIRREDICPPDNPALYDTLFKKLLDIGDIIGISGFAFITKTGELSIHVKELKLLAKSLRPLPIVKEKDGKVFDAFTDPEQRYRRGMST
jgi:lysyl-tRNA synthetase class 2